MLAFGTPGGDQQDQWSLNLFLAHAVYGLNLQAAIDAPMFHSDALPELVLSARRAAAAWSRSRRACRRRRVAELRRARPRRVEVAEPWSLGRLSAVSRAPDGTLRAGANPRGMQGYAAGR